MGSLFLLSGWNIPRSFKQEEAGGEGNLWASLLSVHTHAHAAYDCYPLGSFEGREREKKWQSLLEKFHKTWLFGFAKGQSTLISLLKLPSSHHSSLWSSSANRINFKYWVPKNNLNVWIKIYIDLRQVLNMCLKSNWTNVTFPYLGCTFHLLTSIPLFTFPLHFFSFVFSSFSFFL